MGDNIGMIYLDNNATTITPGIVLAEMIRWTNHGNPSADYAKARQSRAMMKNFASYIMKVCNSSTRDYKVIFTSGASESNCTIIQMLVNSWVGIDRPHIIISAVEHKSILLMVETLQQRGTIEATIIPVDDGGRINPDDVSRSIKQNTILVAIMHANNETGSINNIRAIADICEYRDVPMHCDVVQTFGKSPIDLRINRITSFSISFHKFHGITGSGVLVIKKSLLDQTHVAPLIFGTQNDGYRGGTENITGIAAGFAALKYTMVDRVAKNTRIHSMKISIMDFLSNVYRTFTFAEYKSSSVILRPREIVIIWLSGDKNYLSNTIMLSILKNVGNGGKPICNAKIKESLEHADIIVSVGSACNTSNPKASHVLYAMGADEQIRKGALRISLGDENTPRDINKFIDVFTATIEKY